MQVAYYHYPYTILVCINTTHWHTVGESWCTSVCMALGGSSTILPLAFLVHTQLDYGE